MHKITTYNKKYYDTHRQDPEWLAKRAEYSRQLHHKQSVQAQHDRCTRLVREVMAYDTVEEAEDYVFSHYRVLEKRDAR